MFIGGGGGGGGAAAAAGGAAGAAGGAGGPGGGGGAGGALTFKNRKKIPKSFTQIFNLPFWCVLRVQLVGGKLDYERPLASRKAAVGYFGVSSVT